jgi:hypothetical protein
LSHIEKNNFESLEALLSQATKGVHILFENKDIAEVFNKLELQELENNKDEVTAEDVYSFENVKIVQDILVELIAKKSLMDKQAYIRSLNSKEYNLLIRAYFNIVESATLSLQNYKH